MTIMRSVWPRQCQGRRGHCRRSWARPRPRHRPSTCRSWPGEGRSPCTRQDRWSRHNHNTQPPPPDPTPLLPPPAPEIILSILKSQHQRNNIVGDKWNMTLVTWSDGQATHNVENMLSKVQLSTDPGHWHWDPPQFRQDRIMSERGEEGNITTLTLIKHLYLTSHLFAPILGVLGCHNLALILSYLRSVLNIENIS